MFTVPLVLVDFCVFDFSRPGRCDKFAVVYYVFGFLSATLANPNE